MEVCGNSVVAGPANVIYLSTILGQDGPVPVHKCNWKCQNEHVCGNMYLCKLTGLTHICDKNCGQRIVCDNHSSLCLASGKIFPLTPAEEQAVKKQMGLCGNSFVAGPANVIYLSTILGQDGPMPVHKCNWKCQNEHVRGNMYRCKLTGLTHICDKNCGQRIVYDNHSSLCLASAKIFPLTPAEEQAVKKQMELCGNSFVAGPANVIYLSTLLGQDGPIPVHKCNWKCQNEHVCGNMYLCKLTGLTHICDKNCDQRIVYDNHSSLCLASGKIFPLTPAEEQAVRGVRRKLDAEGSPSDSCSFKRRRDAQYHPSPFERSFSAVSPICSQVGDGMDMS